MCTRWGVGGGKPEGAGRAKCPTRDGSRTYVPRASTEVVTCTRNGERGEREGPRKQRGRSAGDRHRDAERRPLLSRRLLDEREPSLPHSILGVSPVKRRLKRGSPLFFVGLLPSLLPLRLPWPREPERECERESGFGMMSTRPPLGGMMTNLSPWRGGGRTMGWPGVILYSTKFWGAPAGWWCEAYTTGDARGVA